MIYITGKQSDTKIHLKLSGLASSRKNYLKETYHSFIRGVKINIWMNPPSSYRLQGDAYLRQQSS